MAMSHANCTHPRTPAGRAACRKLGGPGAAAAATPIPAIMSDEDKATRAEVLVDGVHPSRSFKRSRKATGTPTPTNTTPTPRKAGSMALKRSGTQLRTVADMADVPHVFANAIKEAWNLKWVVRVGEPFNDTERRVEVFGTHGVITLVWSNTNPSDVGVFFRPANSSVISRVKTGKVSDGFVMAHDGEAK